MAGIKQLLDLFYILMLFLLGDVLTGKNQVVNDGDCIGSNFEINSYL
ncbi:MAG: hypothetical protein ACR5LD_06475 [Symbiopectobacterium sp.]